MTGLILASTSKWRAAMLRDAGVQIETCAPGVDEEEVKLSLRAENVSPRDQADALAEMKAVRISSRAPGVLVLGADQVLSCNGVAFDKPSDMKSARSQLFSLRGERHDLYSAAVIALDGAPVWRHIGHARLTMRSFSDDFADAYLAELGEEAMATPGSYAIEGTGAQLFSRIDGDHFAIRGLPLLELLAYLRVRGLMLE